MKPKLSLLKLKEDLRKFADERDWNKFHSPKNLSMALAVEASELLEIFQWATEKQSMELSESKMDEAKEEIADILIYTVRLADKLGIDPLEVAFKKIDKNQNKYPVEKSKGSSKKYNEL